jgi:hypothetical protein
MRKLWSLQRSGTLARSAVIAALAAVLAGGGLPVASGASAAPAAAKAAERSAAGIVGSQVAGARIFNNGSGRCLYDSGNASGGTFTGSCP